MVAWQAAQDQLVPLMSEAAFKGDVATMERLVSKGASVNQHDQVGSVLDCRASLCMHVLPMPKIERSRTPKTCRRKSLRESECEICAPGQYDRTPLHFAAFNGHIDAVKWLIDKDADVNVAGMVNGFTPLFAACENNDLDVAKILVEAGADTNAKSRDGGRVCVWRV